MLSVWETLKESRDLQAFLAAASITTCGQILQNKIGITLFAPVNDAFTAIEPQVMDLLFAHHDAFSHIIANHIVPCLMPGDALSERAAIITLDGGLLRFGSQAGARIGGARMIKTDIMCSNGVMHVIEKLLVPTALPKGAPLRYFAGYPIRSREHTWGRKYGI